MDNKLRSQIIAKELLDKDELSISKNKILVPVCIFQYQVDDILFAKLGLHAKAWYNSKKGILPNIDAKSIKNSLTKSNANKIISKYDLDSTNLFINLAVVEEILKEEVEYTELFKKYCYYFYGPSDYFSRKTLFFKHMPLFHYFTNKDSEDIGLTEGHCCEDCDGDVETYIIGRLRHYDFDNIYRKLEKLKIHKK